MEKPERYFRCFFLQAEWEGEKNHFQAIQQIFEIRNIKSGPVSKLIAEVNLWMSSTVSIQTR